MKTNKLPYKVYLVLFCFVMMMTFLVQLVLSNEVFYDKNGKQSDGQYDVEYCRYYYDISSISLTDFSNEIQSWPSSIQLYTAIDLADLRSSTDADLPDICVVTSYSGLDSRELTSRSVLPVDGEIIAVNLLRDVFQYVDSDENSSSRSVMIMDSEYIIRRAGVNSFRLLHTDYRKSNILVTNDSFTSLGSCVNRIAFVFPTPLDKAEHRRLDDFVKNRFSVMSSFQGSDVEGEDEENLSQFLNVLICVLVFLCMIGNVQLLFFYRALFEREYAIYRLCGASLISVQLRQLKNAVFWASLSLAAASLIFEILRHVSHVIKVNQLTSVFYVKMIVTYFLLYLIPLLAKMIMEYKKNVRSITWQDSL